MRKHVLLAEGREQSKIGLDTCSSKSKVTVTTHAASSEQEEEEGRPPRRRWTCFFGEIGF
jgi:hypothetical protein